MVIFSGFFQELTIIHFIGIPDCQRGEVIRIFILRIEPAFFHCRGNRIRGQFEIQFHSVAGTFVDIVRRQIENSGNKILHVMNHTWNAIFRLANTMETLAFFAESRTLPAGIKNRQSGRIQAESFQFVSSSPEQGPNAQRWGI